MIDTTSKMFVSDMCCCVRFLVSPQDDHITVRVVFFPGFQLATGKKGRLLYDLVRAGSQPALGD